MMYVRPNKRPAVDSTLVNRLQREVDRLRALVLKLKEARVLADREAEERSGGTPQVLLVEERARELEKHLGRERMEVSTRHAYGMEDGRGYRQMLWRGEVAPDLVWHTRQG